MFTQTVMVCSIFMLLYASEMQVQVIVRRRRVSTFSEKGEQFSPACADSLAILIFKSVNKGRENIATLSVTPNAPFLVY